MIELSHWFLLGLSSLEPRLLLAPQGETCHNCPDFTDRLPVKMPKCQTHVSHYVITPRFIRQTPYKMRKTSREGPEMIDPDAFLDNYIKT